jgi:hypothetical protein
MAGAANAPSSPPVATIVSVRPMTAGAVPWRCRETITVKMTPVMAKFSGAATNISARRNGWVSTNRIPSVRAAP